NLTPSCARPFRFARSMSCHRAGAAVARNAASHVDRNGASEGVLRDTKSIEYRTDFGSGHWTVERRRQHVKRIENRLLVSLFASELCLVYVISHRNRKLS